MKRINQLCPTSYLWDVEHTAIYRMNVAYFMNGGTDKGDLLENALAYLISLEEKGE